MNKKTLSYVSFAILGLFVILLFVTAKSYTQLGLAIAAYPIIAYFALKVFPRTVEKYPVAAVVSNVSSIPQQNIPITGKVDVVDVDKRTFLRLIGATGISFFLFSLLGRRAETLLFGENIESRLSMIEGSLTGNPSNSVPTVSPNQGYRISEVNNSEDGTYYAFINEKGQWFIMKEDIESGSFRYSRGDSEFPENWDRRNKLTYDYYHNVFKQAK